MINFTVNFSLFLPEAKTAHEAAPRNGRPAARDAVAERRGAAVVLRRFQRCYVDTASDARGRRRPRRGAAPRRKLYTHSGLCNLARGVI